jgi:hypothetical protein
MDMEPADISNNPESDNPTRSRRILRAVLLATAIYAPLVWVYASFRVIFDHIDVWDRFVLFVPYFLFWTTALLAFLVGFFSLIGYLMVRDQSRPLINIQINWTKKK